MNNLDYLEYEGSRLLDYAMKTYSKASTGSLVNDIEHAVLAEKIDFVFCKAFADIARGHIVGSGDVAADNENADEYYQQCADEYAGENG